MATEHRLTELDLQMAAYQLSRQHRFSHGSTPKRWSGRIEKPRSQQSSPAVDCRRRAYSTARHAPTGQYNTSTSQTYAPRQAARPFSWGPTTATTMRVPDMTYLVSPATSSYVTTPAYSSYTSTPSYQYPTMQPMYHDVSEFTKSSQRTASVTSASSYYSNDSRSSGSPLWNNQSNETIKSTYAMEPTNYGSPEHSSFWPYSMPAQSTAMPSSQAMHSSPIYAVESFYGNKYSNCSYPSENLLDRPPSPDLLWSGKKVEDDGEVLVALGLYDLPSDYDSPLEVPRKLKLAETWQPPPTPAAEDDEESAEEDAVEEIEFPKPAAGTSWFI